MSLIPLNITETDTFSHTDPDGIVVIMPCIDPEKAQKTAEILERRAKTPCTILMVNDTLRQGFIKTLNQTASRVRAKYIVYLAQDALPGRDWLKGAFKRLEKSGKGLLAFNDGKWHGRIASFGMVRSDWVKQLYGGDILFSGYKAHKADNELTVIARIMDMFEYSPDCSLMEFDPEKDVVGGSNPVDDALFEKRFVTGFDGRVPLEGARKLAGEYRVKWQYKGSKTYGISILVSDVDTPDQLDRFLTSFFNTNTHSPVEFIITDCNTIGSTEEVIARHAKRAFIRYIQLPGSPAAATGEPSLKTAHAGADRARYPYLLFLNSHILLTTDLLTNAVEKLESEDKTDAVIIRLKDTPRKEGSDNIHYSPLNTENNDLSRLIPDTLLKKDTLLLCRKVHETTP